MLANKDSDEDRKLFELAFGPRPAEELYDLAKDPDQMNNVALDPAYARAKQKLAQRLQSKLLNGLRDRFAPES